MIEPDEEPAEAALREVREETGLVAEIDEDLGSISYFYQWDDVGVRKSVRFFLMHATGGDLSDHDHEMEEVRWFPVAEAPRRTTYRSEREVVEKAVRSSRTTADPGEANGPTDAGTPRPPSRPGPRRCLQCAAPR